MVMTSTDIKVFTLTHPSGFQAKVCNLGGIVMAIEAPDRYGHLGNVVLGYDDASHYIDNPNYLGALIGRCANRIAHGTFKLDGKLFKLAKNNGTNHLHGGIRGFNQAIWRVLAPVEDEFESLSKITFLLESPNNDEGYPGHLSVKVTYTISDDFTFKIDYVATTSDPTIVNLTSHCYFNLGANLASCPDILGHRLKIYAHNFTPMSESIIPLGTINPVKGTPFDFLSFKPIGKDIQSNDPQMKIGHGYDHNFVIDGERGVLRIAAEVEEPRSGRRMQVWTTEPGLQFYSGNFLDSWPFGRRSGFCLEAQHFPDSPNQPGFPSVVLRPGQIYRQTTIYRFST